MINQYGEPTTPHKLSTGTKPSVANIRVLFCQFFVLKVTANVDEKVLNMCHQPQKGVQGIFVGFPEQ